MEEVKYTAKAINLRNDNKVLLKLTYPDKMVGKPRFDIQLQDNKIINVKLQLSQKVSDNILDIYKNIARRLILEIITNRLPYIGNDYQEVIMKF